MKPQLQFYIGKKVTDVVQAVDDDIKWQWFIELEGGIHIVNKSREEIFPAVEIIGAILTSISLSLRDTTLFFRAPTGYIHRVSFKPTQYAIYDPKYGGEAYPQWPEELEEMGIPSHPEEKVSDPPSEEWAAERERLLDEEDIRREREAKKFLTEETQ